LKEKHVEAIEDMDMKAIEEVDIEAEPIRVDAKLDTSGN